MIHAFFRGPEHSQCNAPYLNPYGQRAILKSAAINAHRGTASLGLCDGINIVKNNRYEDQHETDYSVRLSHEGLLMRIPYSVTQLVRLH